MYVRTWNRRKLPHVSSGVTIVLYTATLNIMDLICNGNPNIVCWQQLFILG